MAGTRWVQTDVLEKNRAADLRVYAVWFDMMPNDSREKWKASLLSDPRVSHYWDEPKSIGSWYAARIDSIRPKLTPDSKWGDGDVLWDAWLLYGRDATWAGVEPTGLIEWGRTIVMSRDSLKRAVAALR